MEVLWRLLSLLMAGLASDASEQCVEKDVPYAAYYEQLRALQAAPAKPDEVCATGTGFCAAYVQPPSTNAALDRMVNLLCPAEGAALLNCRESGCTTLQIAAEKYAQLCCCRVGERCDPLKGGDEEYVPPPLNAQTSPPRRAARNSHAPSLRAQASAILLLLPLRFWLC